jgi:hypothetical protein
VKRQEDVLRTDWDMEFDEDFFVICRPGTGEEAMSVYAPKNKKDRERVARLITNSPKLLRAAETILRDLNQRLRIANERGGHKVPIYSGIADLHDAIADCGGEV